MTGAAAEQAEQLPSARAAIGRELARVCHSPYEVPIVVACNGLLMVGAWFLAPPAMLVAKLGALAFPLMLASWMFSDVPATNVLGSDAEHSLTLLDHPGRLRRTLYAKNIALWVFVAPLCLAVAVGIGTYEHRPVATIFSLIWIAFAPLGAIGIAAWLGIVYPYHPLPLAYRWRQRRRFRVMIVRWSILVVAPYLLVPALTGVILAPTLLLWLLVAHNGGRMSDWLFAIGAGLACAVGLVAWIGGHRWGVRIAYRRRAKLADFLADRSRG